MRRPLLLLAGLALLGGLAWRWARPADLRLDLDPRSREVALILGEEAAGRRTSGAVLAGLAELAEPAHRGELRARLKEPGKTAAVGFAPGRPPEYRSPAEGPADRGRILPGTARLQLRGVPHGYLVAHAAPVAPFLETAARRRWLAPALLEAGREAESLGLAVGEGDDGAFLVATLAFAYPTGEQAEAALRRLTEKQGDYLALGFAARPGADRITRQTKLLVIRFDVETDLVLRALGR